MIESPILYVIWNLQCFILWSSRFYVPKHSNTRFPSQGVVLESILLYMGSSRGPNLNKKRGKKTFYSWLQEGSVSHTPILYAQTLRYNIPILTGDLQAAMISYHQSITQIHHHIIQSATQMRMRVLKKRMNPNGNSSGSASHGDTLNILTRTSLRNS